MKNKFFKCLLAIMLIIPCVFAFAGCVNSGTYIEFETWGGSHISSKHYEYNPYGSTISPSDFGKPTKVGYKFLNWYADENFNTIIDSSMVATNSSVKYYAKYEIDYSYFPAGRLVQWGTFDSSPRILDATITGITDVYVLFEKTNMAQQFNSITIETTNSSGFICKNIVVYDENGKPVADNDANATVFVPTNKTSSAVKYVIKVSAITSGSFRLTFN